MLAVALAVLASACGSDDDNAAPDTTGAASGTTVVSAEKKDCKIGATRAYSGAIAVFGEWSTDGEDLGLEEVNADPARHYKFSIIREDTQFEPAKGVAALSKLVSVDKVPIVLTMGTGQMTAQAPVAQSADVALMNTAGNSPVMFDLWKKFGMFSIINDSGSQGAFLANVASDAGFKRIGLVYLANDYGSVPAESFKTEAAKLGLEIVAEATAEGFEATDFRSQWVKLVASKPDAVMTGVAVAQVGPMLRHARDAGFTGQLLTFEGTVEEASIKDSGDLLNGIIATKQFVPELIETAVGKDFIAKFQAKYGKEPNVYNATGYDAIRLIADAAEGGGCDDGPSMKRELAKLTAFEGVMGPLDMSKGAPQVPFGLVTVVNGVVTPYTK